MHDRRKAESAEGNSCCKSARAPSAIVATASGDPRAIERRASWMVRTWKGGATRRAERCNARRFRILSRCAVRLSKRSKSCTKAQIWIERYERILQLRKPCLLRYGEKEKAAANEPVPQTDREEERQQHALIVPSHQFVLAARRRARSACVAWTRGIRVCSKMV